MPFHASFTTLKRLGNNTIDLPPPPVITRMNSCSAEEYTVTYQFLTSGTYQSLSVKQKFITVITRDGVHTIFEGMTLTLLFGTFGVRCNSRDTNSGCELLR